MNIATAAFGDELDALRKTSAEAFDEQKVRRARSARSPSHCPPFRPLSVALPPGPARAMRLLHDRDLLRSSVILTMTLLPVAATIAVATVRWTLTGGRDGV